MQPCNPLFSDTLGAGDERRISNQCTIRTRHAAPGKHVVSASTHRGAPQKMIRKLPNGRYRLYSREPNPKTGKRRNLGTFASRSAAAKHERAIQYFKRR